jgi:prepilin-type N-terminal cleavage/methylation domain-containing protein
MRGRRPGAGGFTLIEVIVVIAVISILAAMAVPYAVKILDQSREEATKKQMEEIHRAIMGDPKGPTAGYLGDMGALPATLTLLNTQGAQAGPTTGTLGVKYGWYGQYVKIGYSAGAYLVDGWGTTLVYNSPGAGQITSYGPNRVVGGGDDITYPSSPVVPSGRLLVNLYVWDNTNYVLNPSHLVAPTTVRLYYAVNGGRVLTTLGTPADPSYTFPPVHAGFHEVEAIFPPDLITVRGRAVVYIPENNQQTQVNLYLR